MANSFQVKEKVSIRKRNQVVATAALFPAVIVSIALVRQLTEYYFRFSKEYKSIYVIINTLGLFIQLTTLLASIAFSLYLLLERKTTNNCRAKSVAVVLSTSPLVWIVIHIVLFR